ncbi:MAG: PPOX class F420-dependent oxidoreductase [Solirubrobacteraceae bacterium]
MTPTGFTPEQLSYLRTQPIGRLATVDEQHAPQVVPVGFFVDEQTGVVSISGTALGSTRKFRNIEATGRAALVVDDLASMAPWQVRGIEIRGHAEAKRDVDPPRPGMSRELILIHPARIRSWGMRES